jgi:hypothetical protein
MKRWLTGTVLLISACHMFSGAAYAQLKEDFELNLFVAGTVHSKHRYEIGFPQSPTPIPGEFRLDKGLRGGIRANLGTNGHWGEEVFYSYEPNEAHFTAASRSLNLDIQIHNIGVNALYYLSPNEARLTRIFLSAGIGAAIFRPTAESRAIVRDPLRGNLPDLDQSNEIAFNYGGGVKTKLGAVVDLRVDARGFAGRSPSFGLARESSNPNAAVFPATGAIHSGEISAGLVFYFKKR